MIRRLFVAAALAAAVVVSAQMAIPQPVGQQAAAVLHVPGTTPGAPFEDLPGTVFNWSAESWNMIRFPEAFDNAAWTQGTGGSNVVTTTPAPATASASGFAYRYTSGTTGMYQNRTLTAATVYTFSIYVKYVDNPWYRLMFYDGGSNQVRAWFNVQTGAVGTTGQNGTGTYRTSSITAVGNGWYRLSVTGSLAGTTHLFALSAQTGDAATAIVNGAQVLIWGAQVVPGTVPLPYKPNPGSTVGGAGDTLTMTGTVPLVSTTAAWPRGTGAGRRGVGTFTDANHFRTATVNDAFDFPGDFTLCLAYRTPGGQAGGLGLIGASSGVGSAGFDLVNSGVGAGLFGIYARHTGGGNATVANASIVGALNIGCTGRVGNVWYVKANGGTTASATSAGWSPKTDVASYIGRLSSASAAFTGVIYEVWASSTPWAEANVAAIEARAMARGNGSEPLFAPDANTVLHLRGDAFDGTTWKAPQAALTTVGTVGYSNAWVQPVAGTRQAVGYGVFSDANYLSFGTNSDILDFATAPFSHCTAYTPSPAYSVSGRPYTNGDTSSRGTSISVQTNGVYHIIGGTSKGAGPATFGARNVTCCGYDGVNSICKTNRGALNTVATTYLPGTNVLAYWGRSNGAGASFNGTVDGFWAAPVTPSDALFTSIINRALGQTDAFGNALSVTRTTTTRVEVPSQSTALWTVPAGLAAVGSDGTQVWRQTWNQALRSETMDDGVSWSQTRTTYSTDAAVAPNGTTTADKLIEDATAGNTHHTQFSLGAAAVGPWTASFYVKAAERGFAAVRISTDSLPTYAVVVDLATGLPTSPTGTISTNSPVNPSYTIKSVGDGWWRISATATHLDSTKTVSAALAVVNAATGWAQSSGLPTYNGDGASGVYVWGGSLENQPYPTPYITTTTTSVQRNVDAITAGHTLTGNDRSWCVSGVYAPGSWTWNNSTRHGLWSMGTEGQANSAWLGLKDGLLTFGVKSATYQDGLVTFDVGSTGALTTSEPHAVKACVIDSSRVALWWDGQPVAAASNGGDLTWTPPSTIRMGLLSDGATAWDGGIRDFKVERYSPTKAELVALDTIMLGSYQFAATGQAIPENILGDASKVVTHLVWNGTALVDTKGGSWSMNGTVPQVTTGPWYPQGFTSNPKPGAGPYSIANQYASTDPNFLGTNGDLTVCVVYESTGTEANNNLLVSTGAHQTNGWNLWSRPDTASSCTFGTNTSGAVVLSNASTTQVVGLHVCCGGRSGANQYALIDLGTQDTDPNPYTDVGTLGRVGQTASIGPSNVTVIREVFVSTSAYDDTLVRKLQRHVFGLAGNAAQSTQQAVSLTRPSPRTCELPDEGGGGNATYVYSMASGTPCINKKGLQIEPLRVNYAQMSSNSCSAGAVVAPWTSSGVGGVTCVADQAVAPDGTTTMDEFTSAGNTARAQQQPTTPASSTFVGSAWVQKAVVGPVGVNVRCDATGVANPTACTCWRSDGGVCTVSGTTVAECVGTAQNVGTTPVRLSVAVTCNTTYTTPIFMLIPGEWSVSTGTARFWGAQLEVGTYLTSHVPTPAAATVTRNGDQPTVANPFFALNPASWCIGATGTPEYGRSWTSTDGYPAIFTMGNYASANSSAQFVYGAFSVADAAGALKTAGPVAIGAAGTTNAVMSCTDNGTLSVRSNGTAVTGAITGTGTGVIGTMNATVYLGHIYSPGYYTGGFLRNFRFCPTNDYRRCY